jgi:oligopeptide transport system permease protein
MPDHLLNKGEEELEELSIPNKRLAGLSITKEEMKEQSISKELFGFDSINKDEAERMVRPSISYWKDARRRFLKNRIATFAMLLLLSVILFAIFAPILSKYNYCKQDYLNINQSPNSQYWFGTDDLGRDIFVRCWEGARVSLYIAVVAVFLNCFLGILYGGVSGYFGGVVDLVMMRFCEIISSVPSMLWIILLTLILKPGIMSIIIALALTGWVGEARLFRGQVLQIRELEYVLASRTLGAKPLWIIFKHLFPNALSPIITSMAFAIPGAIFAEAFLSYIGLGIPMPFASWGVLASDGAGKIMEYPYQLVFPALLICITMLAFNLIGDGLRDSLDPRLRN